MQIEIVTIPNNDLKETGFGPILSCEHVLAAIEEAGHSVSISLCSTKYELEKVVKRKPDLVVLGVKYLPVRSEEDLWLSSYFESHNINHTGSLRETLRSDSDKVYAKSIIIKDKIKTSKYFTALPGEYRSQGDIPFSFPLFLKPIDAANGNGVDDNSYVSSFEEFEKKVLSLHNQYQQRVLVEEYLDGREFTVAIVENSKKELIVAAVEILPPESRNGLRILGMKAKSDNSEVLMKIMDSNLCREIKDTAIEAFKSLGVRDFGRIDIKLNKKDECFFMEANLVPGMTAVTSYFPRAFSLDLGMTYDQVIQLIIEQGLSRVLKVPVNQGISC